MQLVGRPATALAKEVGKGDVSAVEVVQAHLDHLASVEHRLDAFVSVRRRAALDEAAAVDARDDRAQLPLAGVPVAVTDTIDVAGEPTRHGSAATSEAPVDRDDEVVARLRQAGAVILGKTRCPELSLWGTADGPDGISVNPWDPTRTSGGASGGSAAAVSAGVVPVAVGVDGWGSVRIPAAACGTFGIKPGGDLAPVTIEGEPHWYGMSRYGPITTTVADGALLLDVLAGTTALRELGEVPTPLRVAVSFRPPAPGVVVSAPWREAALEAGRLLHHAGHDVSREEPPYDPSSVQAAISRWTQGPLREVELRGLDREALQPRTRSHLHRGEQLARVRPVDEDDVTAWTTRLAPFFREFDVLVMPAMARMPLAANEWHAKTWVANVAANLSAYPFTGAWNLGDLPAAVVPLWEDTGRPLAVQVVAPKGREDLVLAVAAHLEQTVGWIRHAPGWDVPA